MSFTSLGASSAIFGHFLWFSTALSIIDNDPLTVVDT